MTSDRGSAVLARLGKSKTAYGGRSSGEDRLEGATAKNRRRWEDDIKLDLKKLGGGRGLDSCGWDREKWCAVANTVMNRRVLHNVCNFLTSSKNIGL